jgi:hypothetical protein
MATISIVNDNLRLIYTEDSTTTYILKDNCRVLAFGDVVRITDYAGNRFEFLYTDVVAPSESSASDLKDTLDLYLQTIVGGGGGSGTVTSVGLSVPAPTNPAFTVSGSPVTTSGTIEIVATGTTSDYVRGNGSRANFEDSVGALTDIEYLLVQSFRSTYNY